MTSFFENLANCAGLGSNDDMEMASLPPSINGFKINGNQAEKEVTLSNGKKAMLVVVFPKGANTSIIKKYLGVFDKPTTEATVRAAETLGLGRPATAAVNGKKAKKAINAMHITLENGQMQFTKKYNDNTEKKVNAEKYEKSQATERRKLKFNAIQNLQALAQQRINDLKL